MACKSEDGYILPSVLLTVFLLTTLLMGIIITVTFSYRMDIKRFNKKRLELACYSALQRHMALRSRETGPGKYDIMLDSCLITIKYNLKGLFMQVSVKAEKGSDSVKLLYTLNRTMSPEFTNALVISRPNTTPSVAGQTRITGDVLMSSSRIVRGTVYGIRNTIEKYHFGTIRSSKEIKLKLFADSLVRQIFSYAIDSTFIVRRGSVSLTPAEIDTMRSLYVIGNVLISGVETGKPSSPNKKIYASGHIRIASETVLRSQLEVHTDSTAEIGMNTDIKNLMIAADKGITVLPGGRYQAVQLFSRRSISCDRSQFNFPSVLCSYSDTLGRYGMQNQINLKESIINGSALLVCEVVGLGNNRSRIIVDEKSSLQGIVYSENLAELHGPVYGSVYVNSLWYYKEPTEYQNWLINLTIDRGKLDSLFLLPSGIADKGRYKIVETEWIY